MTTEEGKESSQDSLWFEFKKAQSLNEERKEFVEGAETLLREAVGLKLAEIAEELKELKEENARLQKEFEERREIWYRDYCQRFVKKRKEDSF